MNHWHPSQFPYSCWSLPAKRGDWVHQFVYSLWVSLRVMSVRKPDAAAGGHRTLLPVSSGGRWVRVRVKGYKERLRPPDLFSVTLCLCLLVCRFFFAIYFQEKRHVLEATSLWTFLRTGCFKTTEQITLFQAEVAHRKLADHLKQFLKNWDGDPMGCQLICSTLLLGSRLKPCVTSKSLFLSIFGWNMFRWVMVPNSHKELFQPFLLWESINGKGEERGDAW